MSYSKQIFEIELQPAGGIIDVAQGPLENKFELIKISGNDTLTGALSIVSTGDYTTSSYIQVFWSATMDFDGKSVDILGRAIPESLESKRFVMHCFFDGSVWDTYIVVDPFIPQIIPGLAEIETLVDSPAEAQILLADDSGEFEKKSISGAISIDKDGVTEYEDASIAPEKLNFGLDSVIVGYEKVLSNGQLTNLFTNPIEILSDAGVPAGTFISIHQVAFSYKYDAASLVLADDFELQYNDGTAIMDIPQAELIQANDVIWWVPNTAKTIAVAGKGIRLAAKTGNPSGGGASTTLKARIYYTATEI